MIRILYRLLPEKTKRQLTIVIRQELKAKRLNESKTLPYTELTENHIQNLKVVVNRSELLNILPHKGVVAELGVDNGDFSNQILR